MQVTSCKSSATYFSLSVIYLLCQEHSPFFSLWIPRANRAPGPWCLEPTAPPGLLPCQRKGFWRKPWRGKYGVRRDGSQTSSDDSICLCFSLGFGKPLPVMPRFYLDKNGQKKESESMKWKNKSRPLRPNFQGFHANSHIYALTGQALKFFSPLKTLGKKITCFVGLWRRVDNLNLYVCV